MHRQYFLDQINTLITKFNNENYNLNDLQVSFAISVILINQFNLTNQFNELMQVYKDSKVVTIDSKLIEDIKE